MTLTPRTEAAIAACYDAILMPDIWPEALRDLAQSLNADGCLMHPHEPERTPLRVPCSAGLEEIGALWSKLEEAAPSPHSRRAPRLVHAGATAILEEQIVGPQERHRLAYYSEVARPARLEWWSSSCFSVADRFWCLPVFRGGQRGPFTEKDARGLSAVGPALGRMLALAERLSDSANRDALSLLEATGRAAMLVDWRGHVKALNQAADDLLCDDLKLSRGRLIAGTAADGADLARLLNSLKRTGIASAQPAIVLRRDSPWLLVEAMPVTGLGAGLFGEGRAVLILTDLTAAPMPSAALLATVFHLTAAEARLAVALAGGHGVVAAAASLGISHNTARSQLKEICAKTGVRRQSELTALLARLSPSGRR